MTKFIVIASGKGGVGKTTTALNLGTALTDFGRDVIVVDGNITKPDIGLHLGKHNLPSSLHEVLKGKKNIREIIYLHPSGLKVIPTSMSNFDMQDVEVQKLAESLKELDGITEIVLIDAASGLHDEAIAALKAADEVILVTTPDILSVTDCLKTAHLARKLGKKIIGVIINRQEGHHSELKPRNIELMLEAKVIGIIPEDKNLKEALQLKHPVVYSHPESPSSINFKKVAAYLIGTTYEYPIKKDTQLEKFLKKTGIKE